MGLQVVVLAAAICGRGAPVVTDVDNDGSEWCDEESDMPTWAWTAGLVVFWERVGERGRGRSGRGDAAAAGNGRRRRRRGRREQGRRRTAAAQEVW